MLWSFKLKTILKGGVITLLGGNSKTFKFKKNLKKYKALIYSLLLCIGLVFIDQYIKNWIIKNINFKGGFILVPKFLRITYVKNYGAAFSIFFKKTNFLIFFTILVISFFVIYMIKNKPKDKIYIFGVTLISAGGTGNLIDRAYKGYVIDYIDLIFGIFYNFPIFNFADCLIVIGSFTILFKFIKKEFFATKYKAAKKIRF